MAFNSEDIVYVDIFPPIGVARVGDSEEYYLGPEIPHVDPIPEGGFKDANHKIKRQVRSFFVAGVNVPEVKTDDLCSSGRSLPCLCLRERWQCSGRSQR